MLRPAIGRRPEARSISRGGGRRARSIPTAARRPCLSRWRTSPLSPRSSDKARVKPARPDAGDSQGVWGGAEAQRGLKPAVLWQSLGVLNRGGNLRGRIGARWRQADEVRVSPYVLGHLREAPGLLLPPR